MNKIGQFEFPMSVEEARDWKPYVERRALAYNVLAVAKTRVEGAWKAYVGAVPGVNHDMEEAMVLREGTEIHEPIARVMFPRFDKIPYAG